MIFLFFCERQGFAALFPSYVSGAGAKEEGGGVGGCHGPAIKQKKIAEAAHLNAHGFAACPVSMAGHDAGWIWCF